jgi:phosphoribosyl-AMP cyclohydrolase
MSSSQATDETLEFRPRFGADGLLVAVAQDAVSGRILMLAHMNAEALSQTIKTGIAHYWSRSRQSLWMKGETSGNVQRVREMRVDCDQDAILLMVTVEGDGASCHTGRESCFYRVLTDTDDTPRLRFVPE